MAEDYLHQYHCDRRNMTLSYNATMNNYTTVNGSILRMTPTTLLARLCKLMASSHLIGPCDTNCRQIICETTYNTELLEKFVQENEEKLLPEQDAAYP